MVLSKLFKNVWDAVLVVLHKLSFWLAGRDKELDSSEREGVGESIFFGEYMLSGIDRAVCLAYLGAAVTST